MKQINVYFEDEEYKRLARVKDGLSWREFILKLTQEGETNNG
jgi:predicted CopG family antitoxin